MNQDVLFSNPVAFMHSAEMGIDAPILSRHSGWTSIASPRVFQVAQLRKLRACEQVAAICYRNKGGAIEFLLVRTRGGRWIFPKGNAEPGLTHAQAAALEAYEEAGVHGRMEEASFTRYRRKGARSANNESIVTAHLCEVSRMGTPQEINRNPTWFSAEKAKRNLREDRASDYGDQLARVIDRALARLRQLAKDNSPKPNTLQSLRFIDKPLVRLLER